MNRYDLALKRKAAVPKEPRLGIPSVRDWIYVPTQLYIDHGEDDIAGGLGQVSQIKKGISGGEVEAASGNLIKIHKNL